MDCHNDMTPEQRDKLAQAQRIVGHEFARPEYLLSAITHPSAVEGKPVKCSYERLEFLGDSILGAIVASEAFHRYRDLSEGGLTRIKVSLVSGSMLSRVAEELGFSDVIVFGSSERGTGRRGLHSALENVYEAVVAALYLDGGIEVARGFVERTLFQHMSLDLAREPENPKSVLQEKLQEEGITPTYKLIETQGPPHDRTFITQVFAGMQALARGVGRTKKESESQAAKIALDSIAPKQKRKRSRKHRSKDKAAAPVEPQNVARAVYKQDGHKTGQVPGFGPDRADEREGGSRDVAADAAGQVTEQHGAQVHGQQAQAAQAADVNGSAGQKAAAKDAAGGDGAVTGQATAFAHESGEGSATSAGER